MLCGVRVWVEWVEWVLLRNSSSFWNVLWQLAEVLALATATLRGGPSPPDTVNLGHCSTLVVGRQGQLVRYGLAHST